MYCGDKSLRKRLNKKMKGENLTKEKNKGNNANLLTKGWLFEIFCLVEFHKKMSFTFLTLFPFWWISTSPN